MTYKVAFMNIKHGATVAVRSMYWLIYSSSYILYLDLARPPWGREGHLFPSGKYGEIYTR